MAHTQQKLIQVPPGGVCGLGTVFATIQQVLILYLPSGLKRFRIVQEMSPRSLYAVSAFVFHPI